MIKLTDLMSLASSVTVAEKVCEEPIVEPADGVMLEMVGGVVSPPESLPGFLLGDMLLFSAAIKWPWGSSLPLLVRI